MQQNRYHPTLTSISVTELYRHGQFTIHLESTAHIDMEGHCRMADGIETGGILFGYYEPNLEVAHVVAITAPPKDSERGPTWFHRGVDGLQTLAQKLWGQSRARYYLGEWHFHPGSSPEPSAPDREQLLYISRTPEFRCPEPILVIIGQAGSTFTRSVSLVHRGKFLRLAPLPSSVNSST